MFELAALHLGTMIKQLAHVCIHAADLAATEKFYVDMLGLERGFTFMKDDVEIGLYIKLGASTFIEVFQGNPSDEGSIKHFAIEVDDIDAIIERLRSHGCEATDKKLGIDHSWQSWTQDPNGIRIEFHQYTPDSLQLNGGIGEVNW